MKYILFIILIFLINVTIINGDENYLIDEIIIFEQAKEVSGPFGVGISPTATEEWLTYKKIIKKYNSEIIYNQYFLTNSIIAKIYLYIMLWELDYYNIQKIEDDLILFNNIKVYFFVGCYLEELNVNVLIDELKIWIEIYRYYENK